MDSISRKYNKKFDYKCSSKQYFSSSKKYSSIIIDNKKIYHLGSSINHAGSKTFFINILEDEIVKELLIESIGVVYE